MVNWLNGHLTAECCFVFALGALGYGWLEILWRGFTHWSMLLTGGFCFLMIYWLNVLGQRWRWYWQGLTGALWITGAELATGIWVNLILHWQVWDYSRLFFHWNGQISLLYSVLWFFLSIPLFRLSQIIWRWIH